MDIHGISGGASGAEMINMSMMTSVKVLDMAQNAYEDAASEMLAMMAAAMTGVGQNYDATI